MPAALHHIQVERAIWEGKINARFRSIQPSSPGRESCKEFSIKGAKIQFTYKNPGLRARVTRSNLPVICLFIQFG